MMARGTGSTRAAISSARSRPGPRVLAMGECDGVCSCCCRGAERRLSLAACDLPAPDYKVDPVPGAVPQGSGRRGPRQRGHACSTPRATGWTRRASASARSTSRPRRRTRTSNAVAGFYISSRRRARAGRRHGAERRRRGRAPATARAAPPMHAGPGTFSDAAAAPSVSDADVRRRSGQPAPLAPPK